MSNFMKNKQRDNLSTKDRILEIATELFASIEKRDPEVFLNREMNRYIRFRNASKCKRYMIFSIKEKKNP